MKRIVCMAAFFLWALAAVAQQSKIPVIIDIASVEENDTEVLSVFNMPSDGSDHYYLCVGSLGAGDDVVQLLFDPVSQLFLPLGDSREDAVEKLTELKALFDEPLGASLEWQGSLSVGFPSEKTEAVKIMLKRPIFIKKLQLSVERNGYIRATYLTKSNIGAILTLVKMR